MLNEPPDRLTIVLDKIGIPIRVVGHIACVIGIVVVAFSNAPQPNIGEIAISQLTLGQISVSFWWCSITLLFVVGVLKSMVETPNTVTSVKWAKFGLFIMVCAVAMTFLALLGQNRIV